MFYEEEYASNKRTRNRHSKINDDSYTRGQYFESNSHSVTDNLYFANLPEIDNPDKTEEFIKKSLFGFKKFFDNAIQHYKEKKVEAKWKIFGSYYKFELISQKDLPKNWKELKIEIDGKVYSILKLDEHQFSLEQEIQIGRNSFFIFDNRLKLKISNLQKLTKEKISSVWVTLEPADDEIPEERLNVFFEKDTKEVNDGINQYTKIEIIQKLTNKDNRYLLLKQIPSENIISIQYNVYTLKRQREAIFELQERPLESHIPLLRLLQNSNFIEKKSPWVNGELAKVEKWNVLTDDSREGTNEQREFVRKALSTLDFAILEGPPGSGKTTTILEIISQLVKQNKRVLLCASTHVAVDNVIEKLKNTKETEDLLIIRIASDSGNVSDQVQPYMSDEMADTERKRWIEQLNKKKTSDEFNKIRKGLSEHLITEKGKKEAEALLWSSAQVICGTAMGFLQHPFFKDTNEIMDYLILDEASKTTFSEFLVPALKAKRWVIIGDYKQLAPYVEEDLIRDSIQGILKELMPEEISNRNEEDYCFAFLIAQKIIFHSKKLPLILIMEDDKKRSKLKAYIDDLLNDKDICINVNDADKDIQYLPGAGIIIGSLHALERNQGLLPTRVDAIIFYEEKKNIPDWLRRRTSSIDKKDNKLFEIKYPEQKKNLKGDYETHFEYWADNITWRLKRVYELRLFEKDIKDSVAKNKIEKYKKEAKEYYALLNKDADIEKKIKSTQKTCFPSILESLQNGNGVDDEYDAALFKGLPEYAKESRFVRLEYQHRMHPDISKFSREKIYHDIALKDPNEMINRRQMKKGLYEHRVTWVDVRGEEKDNANKKEADVLGKEILKLKEYLTHTNNPFGKEDVPEIAILTFHRGQEWELRNTLREITEDKNKYRYFTLMDNDKLLCNIELCTVDRYQGHEADIVYLSLMKTKGVGFLDSPNRLNVALTRARYQLVILGHRENFRNEKMELLKYLAENTKTIHSTEERKKK